MKCQSPFPSRSEKSSTSASVAYIMLKVKHVWSLTLLCSERPKLNGVLAAQSATGLTRMHSYTRHFNTQWSSMFCTDNMKKQCTCVVLYLDYCLLPQGPLITVEYSEH